MRDVKEKTIGNYTYMCTQYDVITSLAVLRRLGKYLGGPIQEFIKGFDPEKSALDQDLSKLNIGDAIMKLCSSMEDHELMEFLRMACSCVVIKSAPQGQVSGNLVEIAIFDGHFREAGLSNLFKVVVFSVEVNYKGFFGDLVGNLPGVLTT